MRPKDEKTFSEERRVLIVDRSEETREVLRTALGRQGIKTLATPRPRKGLALAREHHPDLIVLDLEVSKSTPEEAYRSFAGDEEVNQTPTLLLGTVKRGDSRQTDGDFVAKPYHYGALIRKIEEMLSE
jgi:two-component system cell cycle response regulator DivK